MNEVQPWSAQSEAMLQDASDNVNDKHRLCMALRWLNTRKATFLNIISICHRPHNALHLHSCKQENRATRLLLINYSLTFSTMVPSTLFTKLRTKQLCMCMGAFPLKAHRWLKFKSVSNSITINTESPQECKLSPLLQVLRTYVWPLIAPTHLWRWQRDTLEVGSCPTMMS